QSWGHRQAIRGPFLVIPYVLRFEEKGKAPREETYYRYVLPARFSADGTLDVEVRRRGIFDVPLYVAHVELGGTFRLPDRSTFPPEAVAIRWDQATLALAVSDPRSIREAVTFAWGDRSIPVDAGLGPFDPYDAGLSAALGLPSSPVIGA